MFNNTTASEVEIADDKLHPTSTTEAIPLSSLCEAHKFDFYWYGKTKLNATPQFYLNNESDFTCYTAQQTNTDIDLHIVQASRWVYSFLANILFISMILTFLLTIFFIRLFGMNRKLRTPMRYILLHMMIIDLLSASTTLILGVWTNSNGYFPGKHAELLCKIEGFFSFYCADTRLMMLILLMFERLLTLLSFGSFSLVEGRVSQKSISRNKRNDFEFNLRGQNL